MIIFPKFKLGYSWRCYKFRYPINYRIEVKTAISATFLPPLAWSSRLERLEFEYVNMKGMSNILCEI